MANQWVTIIGALLGTGGIGALLAIFFLPANQRFAALREGDTARIEDCRKRVAELEAIVEPLRRSERKAVRERDALMLSHDYLGQELRMSATMHELGEKPGTVLVARWKDARDADTVIGELDDQEKP